MQEIVNNATIRALAAGSQVSGADPVTDYGASQNITVGDRKETELQLNGMTLGQLKKMLKEVQDIGYRPDEDAPRNSSDDGVWLHQTLKQLISNHPLDRTHLPPD